MSRCRPKRVVSRRGASISTASVPRPSAGRRTNRAGAGRVCRADCGNLLLPDRTRRACPQRASDRPHGRRHRAIDDGGRLLLRTTRSRQLGRRRRSLRLATHSRQRTLRSTDRLEAQGREIRRIRRRLRVRGDPGSRVRRAERPHENGRRELGGQVVGNGRPACPTARAHLVTSDNRTASTIVAVAQGTHHDAFPVSTPLTMRPATVS
jgi:hypothetical protein